ncbi:hypothetical protein VWM66_10665, partial [Campylobacter jejuni]
IINLLMYFYEKQKGKILLNQEDISTFTIESLHAKIGLVTQNIHPNVLIDQEAILSIHNPYENNTLNFDNNEVKNYKGIITYIK